LISLDCPAPERPFRAVKPDSPTPDNPSRSEAIAMTLKDQILDDVKSAMRARDQKRLTALRLVTATIKQIEVDKRTELDDQGVLAVLDKMVKQRRDSLSQYESAGRDDLAAQEKYEIELISAYLPEALSEEEVAELITQAIGDTGASSMRDMGAVMGKLKGAVQGRADMKAVSEAVRARLGA
jgi:hypothetical protein